MGFRWWWAVAVLVGTFAATSAALYGHHVATASRPKAKPRAAQKDEACPELAALGGDQRDVPPAELEKRYLAGGIFGRAHRRGTLAAIDQHLASQPAKQRACLRRAILANAVNDDVRKRQRGGEEWFMSRSSSELQALYATLELKRPRSHDERQRIAAALSKGVRPGDDPEQARRAKLGQVIGCEATDHELTRIGARRESMCYQAEIADLTTVR